MADEASSSRKPSPAPLHLLPEDDGGSDHHVPLVRENAFSINSGASTPARTTQSAARATSAAVRSDAATIFGKELEEISAAHKQQCLQLAMMRIAHVKQWKQEMENVVIKLSSAALKETEKLPAHLRRYSPHKYLPGDVMVKLNRHIGALNEGAIRSVTTPALATSLLDRCGQQAVVADGRVCACVKVMLEVYKKIHMLVDFCAEHPEHQLSKKDLERAGGWYYTFLRELGTVNSSMEELYVAQEHTPCFAHIFETLLRESVLRRALNGKEDAAASESDISDDATEDATEETEEDDE